MGSLGALLAGAAGPLAKRVMASLGFGVITFVGVSAAVGSLMSTAKASWGAMPADLAAYMALCGGNTAMAILAGAIAARVGLMALKRMALL